ncbi:MAG: hypothetical protein ABIP39_04010 [Polyangiaceae bacterium]
MRRRLSLAIVMLGGLLSLPAQAYEDESAPATPLPPLPTTAPPTVVSPTPVEAEPAPAPTPMAPRPPKFAERFELKLAGGATYKRLFGLPMTMGSVELGLGGRVAEMVAFNVSLDGDFGKTAHGLTTRAITIAPDIELVADRFRIGIGPELLWFGINRATTGVTIAHGGIGFRLVTSFDIVQTDAVTLFVAGRAEAAWLFAGGLPSLTGAAGLRF